MGVRASLIAIKGAEKAQVLSQLGLVETGEYAFADFPELGCAVTPSGWLLVMGPEGFATPERVTPLSMGGEAVGLTSSETVMVNEALGYRKGAQTWSVSHDPGRGPNDLQVQGEPPAQLGAIRDKLVRQQTDDEEGGVDFLFDAAIELVNSICGFRWDETNPAGETVFKMLEPAQTGAAGAAQARRRALYDAVTQRVEGQLYELAKSMGFERAEDRPDFLQHHTPMTNFNTLVRQRDGVWDSLTFVWNLRGELPKVEIYFFVRPLLKRRSGRSGLAQLPAPKRGVIDSLLGRKKAPAETFDSTFDRMAEILIELDAHLKGAAPSPSIIPAIYRD